MNNVPRSIGSRLPTFFEAPPNHDLARALKDKTAGRYAPSQQPHPNESRQALTLPADPPLSRPYGVAFDGINIWVTNGGGNAVSKINPNGVAPGTPTNDTTGTGPRGVAFDGTNIWVANYGSNTVSKIIP